MAEAEGSYHTRTGYDPVDAIRWRLLPRVEAHAEPNTGIVAYRSINFAGGDITTAERGSEEQDLMFLSVGAGVPAYGKVAGTKFTLAANRDKRVTFIPHGCDTSITFGTSSSSTSFLFPLHHLNACLASQGRRVDAPIVFAEDEALFALIPMLEREMVNPSFAGRLMVDSLSQAIAIILARIDPGIFAREAARIALPKWRLRQLLDYIDAHLDEPLGLETLASIACLSTFHFCRVFKQSTGVTPHRYVAERRIERARGLLVQTGMPIENIAVACGFANQRHFTTMFTRAVGISPGRFRAASRQ